MSFNGVMNPQQLTTLTAALDGFCKTAAIERGTDEFDEAGRLVISLFSGGATTAKALKTALESRLLREIERPQPIGRPQND